MKILDDVTDEEIKGLEIPTGVPLVYELNEDMKPVRHFHVGYCAFNIGRLSAEGCASASCCSTKVKLCFKSILGYKLALTMLHCTCVVAKQ